MAKKKWTKPKQMYNGYVYVLKIWFGDDIVYKVGTTNRTPKARLFEIADELYKIKGYIPKMKILKESTTKDNYKVEAEVLRVTDKYKYAIPGLSEFTGDSEIRKMDEDELMKEYSLAMLKDYPADEKFEVSL